MGQSDTLEEKPTKKPRLPSHLTPGNPGNSGGKKGRSGRPPSAIREKLRGSFQKRIKVLEGFADGTIAATGADRLKAIDLMAKYGLGTTNTQTDTEGNDALTLTDAIRAARAAGPDGE